MSLKQTEMDVLQKAVAMVAGEVSDLCFDAIRCARSNMPGDAELTVHTGKHKHVFRVAVRCGILTLAALPVLETLAKQCAPGSSLMVVALKIGPTMAKLLCERDIAFMDAAGNAFLKAPGLYVWISGKRSGVSKVVTGLHRQSAVKVIFALLTDSGPDKEPDQALLNSPVRILAKAAGVATGSVSNVLNDLRSTGFLLDDNGARRLVDRERLIELWTTNYLARFRHRLIHHRYRVASVREWERMHSLPPNAWWSGEVAGARLTRHLRPEKMTVYANALFDEWVVRVGLRPDPDGNVEVLTPFWGDDLISRWHRAPDDFPKDCVHPLLVYADLLANDEERSSETAKRLYDKFLRKLTAPG